MYRQLVIVIIFLIALGCENSERSKGDKTTIVVGLDEYYHEYLVALGELPTQHVQCVAMFRKGDEFAKATLLPRGYEVYLDDTPVPPDSTAPASYSMEINRQRFKEGHHCWRLKHNGKLLLEVPFTFSTFHFEEKIPATLGDRDITLHPQGLKDGQSVEFWFDNIDIDNDEHTFSDTITGNAITLKASDMRKLKPGPYQLRVSCIEQKPVATEGKEVGKSDASYLLDPIPVEVKHI